MSKREKGEGFTIIEVVLVLAIAALIFLMVFIAFPALQRSQRDTGRKNAVGTVISAVLDYSSVHRGSLPTTYNDLAGYVSELTEADYVVKVGSITADDTDVTVDSQGNGIDIIQVYTGGKCDVDDIELVDKGSARQYAVVTILETGDGTPYCQNG